MLEASPSAQEKTKALSAHCQLLLECLAYVYQAFHPESLSSLLK